MGPATNTLEIEVAPGVEGRAVKERVWLRRAGWTVVALSCAQVVLFGYGRDQGIYAVVADVVLGGGMPYRDVWDFKPPGIFVVYAAAQALFGKAMSSVRILECAGLVALVLAFRSIGGNAFSSRRAGLVGGAVAALIHAQLEFWHTAQPESFGGMLTALALAAVIGAEARAEPPARAKRVWAGAGVLLGVAFLMKPPLGGAAIPLAAYVAAGRFRASRTSAALAAPFLIFGAASVLPIAACAAWFWLRGAWPALSWTLFEFTPGYTRLGWHGSPLGLFLYGFEDAFARFSYLLAPGVAAAVLLPALSPRERGALALLGGVVAVQVAGIAMQAKFFQYHFGATLPLLGLVAGLGIFKVGRFVRRGGLAATAAYAAALVALAAARVAVRDVPGTFWERSAARLQFLIFREPQREVLDERLYYVADYDLDVDREAARVVARLTRPDEPVFVWGFEPAIYWMADRRPASRYVYDVPQRATWERDRARRELLADLAASPPAAVVVQHGDYFRYVTGDDLDSHGALATFPELSDEIASRYRLAESVEDLDVYVRR